jgi:uncharacterized DUF497 family protein
VGPTQERAQLGPERVDFAFGATIFAGPTLERTDTRRDYGEVRRIAIERTHGICLTVVYTDRTDADGLIRRIISARRSKRHETRAYAKAYPQP